jgi:apolipoprotein N-acyltransferase
MRGDIAAAVGGFIGAIASIPASSIAIQLFVTLLRPADDVLELFVLWAVPLGVTLGEIGGCWLNLKMQGYAKVDRTALILTGLLVPGWMVLYFLSARGTEWFLLVGALLMFGLAWLARHLTRDRNLFTTLFDRLPKVQRARNRRQQNPAHEVNSGIE